MTRGNPVGVEALLAHFNPQNGSFIGIGKSSTDNLPLIGQLKYSPGERAARLSFALSATSDLHDLVGLLDALARQAGQMGALNLLAEVEENSPAFEALRRSGFAVYAWQEIYRLPFNNDSQEELPDERWNYVDGNTEWAVRSLFASLVPPIVQGAEPLPQQLGGYVYSQNGEVLAYVESVFGPQGVYLRPLIHPTMDKIPSLLLGLRLKLSPLLGRPVYLAMRSYYAWLETTLDSLGECCLERQALLVKHLTIKNRVPETSPALRAIKGKHIEPTTPLVHNITSPEEKR